MPRGAAQALIRTAPEWQTPINKIRHDFQKGELEPGTLGCGRCQGDDHFRATSALLPGPVAAPTFSGICFIRATFSELR